MSSTRHEPVDHTADGCQAASLSLTAACLRGLKKACPVESEKTAWFFAAHSPNRARLLPDVELGCTLSMRPLSLLKSGRLVRSPVEPHGEDDTYPDISQGTNSHTVTFAFGSFAKVLVQCPGFRQSGLPSERVERIAQGLHAGRAGEAHRLLRGSRQCRRAWHPSTRRGFRRSLRAGATGRWPAPSLSPPCPRRVGPASQRRPLRWPPSPARPGGGRIRPNSVPGPRLP